LPFFFLWNDFVRILENPCRRQKVTTAGLHQVLDQVKANSWVISGSWFRGQKLVSGGAAAPKILSGISFSRSGGIKEAGSA
jgi:hypothetical protein